ncbi:diaminopimelate epimerase [Chlamydiifrater phoenicopteri]|uniref:diaminopimelate epimerase n=1 Tax=Chlamydiifrater phoenicopteri TaxID=2681469 RepID=UPI001BCFBB34|nr:diaminopimelate epimerase [Chlamydiifrater phoenicopteri]
MNGSYRKYSGAGNTFTICEEDLSDEEGSLLSRTVGTDGLLVLSKSSFADVRVRIFNSDGSLAEMCGNGLRCLVFHVANQRGLSEVSVETSSGIYKALVSSSGKVTVDMTREDWRFRPVSLGRSFFPESRMFYLNTGVPHLVVFLPNVLSDEEVFDYGRKLRWHDAFSPTGVNVNFATFIGNKEVRVSTYERGLERESLACGTGAVAVALSAMFLQPLGHEVYVKTKSGAVLVVEFSEDRKKVLLTGPVKEIAPEEEKALV